MDITKKKFSESVTLPKTNINHLYPLFDEKVLNGGKIINKYRQDKKEQIFSKWYDKHRFYLEMVYNHITSVIKFNIQYDDFCSILYYSNN